MMIREKKMNNSSVYEFLGFYKNDRLEGHERYYDPVSSFNYDKILFCYPRYSENHYIVALQYDSYRYDKELKKEYITNKDYCIEKSELNNSDYIYENMKLLALEHAANKERYNEKLYFLDYSKLEEKLFRLAYTNIDSHLIDDPDEMQKQILIESKELVNEFIRFMGE